MTPLMIGLIGGTGLGNALADQLTGERREVQTPFGKPSAPITMGTWQGVNIAFLPRHGEHHAFPPTAVPYRANILALKTVGVTHIIASGATGSLREEIRPRDLVVPDQVIDRTTQRVATYFDQPGAAAHVEFSEPFCPTVRRLICEAGESCGTTLHEGGTYMCMEGPEFSTAAESRMHRSWGGDLIGMTCMPEAKLAREAGICYALIALPTDYDCWKDRDTHDQEELLKEIMGNVEHATHNAVGLIESTLSRIASHPPPACRCPRALDLAVWTRPEHIPSEVIDKLRLILPGRITK